MAQGVPLRVYQFTVGTESASFANSPAQHSTTNLDTISFSNVYFTGSVSIDSDPTSVSSDDVEFQIYNLNKSTRQALMRENATVMLRAGYDTNWQRGSDGEIITQYDSLPIIFVGGVVHAYSYKEPGSNDVVTVVNCSSDQKLREMSKGSVTYKPKTPKADVIKDLVKQLGLPVSRMELSSLGDVAYPSGLAVYGQTSVALTKICKECGLQYSIHNGSISVIRADSRPEDQSDKSVEAWLITPDQLRDLKVYFEQRSTVLKPKKSSNSSRGATNKVLPDDTTVTKADGIRTKTKHGINLTTFLNGLFKIHDFVQLSGINSVTPDGADGELHDGVYRVIAIEHKVSYPEGDFTTSIKIVEVD